MSVDITIQFKGRNLTLPINPEQITPSRTAQNTDIDIIGLGKATRKGEPGLLSFSISSFFPSRNSYFGKRVTPKQCIKFINNIWKSENINNNVAKIYTRGLPVNINMYFVIESFKYDHKAGEEEDIYYTLDIKEYIPYGTKVVDVQFSGAGGNRVDSTSIGTDTTVKTYTVESGDCLWNIAKASTGNANDWQQLYELNKGIIGNNPNLIYPGQVLTLPEGWASPQAVVKLRNTTKKNTTQSKPVKTEDVIKMEEYNKHRVKQVEFGNLASRSTFVPVQDNTFYFNRNR